MPPDVAASARLAALASRSTSGPGGAVVTPASGDGAGPRGTMPGSAGPPLFQSAL